MDLSVGAIVLLVVAIGGVFWFFPRMPGIAQIVAAIVGFIVCAILAAKLLGIPINM